MNTKKQKLLALVLTVALVIGILPVSALAEYFSDTRWHWAEDAIEEWAAYGILGGYGDGTFLPNQNITRAEMAKILDVMIGYQELGNVSFPDVTADRWFYEHVLRLATAGVMEGSLGKALPDNPITRQEAVVLIARAFQVTGEGNAAPFLDEAAVAAWAIDHVRAMKSRGYIQGTYNEFKPTDNITRAELVTILDNMFPGYYNAKGEYESTAKRVIEGNTAVSASGVTLKNMEIEGDLYLLQGIADGEVHLKDVTVKGRIYVWGGGDESIYFDHCTIESLTVGLDGVKVVYQNGTRAAYTGADAGEIVIGKDCRVENLIVDAEADISIAQGATVDKLEQTGGTVVSNGTIKELEQWDGVVENGAVGVITLYTAQRDAASMLNNGTVTKAVIEDDSVYRNNGTTKEMVINAPIDVTGTGTIEVARVNVNNVTFDMEPRDVYVDGSVTVPPKFDEEWDNGDDDPWYPIYSAVSAISFEGDDTIWVKLSYNAEATDFTVTVGGVTYLVNRDYTVTKEAGDLYKIKLTGVTLGAGVNVTVAGKSPLATTAKTVTYKALLTLDSMSFFGRDAIQVTLNEAAALTSADLTRFVLRYNDGQKDTVLTPTGLTKISDQVYAITLPSLDGMSGILKVKSANELITSFDFRAPVLNSGAIGDLTLTGNAADTVIADGGLTLVLTFSENVYKFVGHDQTPLSAADLGGAGSIFQLIRNTGTIDLTNATLTMADGKVTITVPQADLGTGSYTLTVDSSRLYDSSGNPGAGSTAYRFTIGGKATPVMTGSVEDGKLIISYDATGFETYHSALQQIVLTGGDTYTIPAGSILRQAGKLTANLPDALDGVYTVQLSATGFLTAQLTQVTLDTTPPSLPAATVNFNGTVFEGKLLERGFFDLVFSETLGNADALPDAMFAALDATADQVAVHINGATVKVTVQPGQSLTLGTFTLAPGTVTDAHGNAAGSISFALNRSNRPAAPQLAGDITVPVSRNTPVTLTSGYNQYGYEIYAVPVTDGAYDLANKVLVQAADITGETVTVNLPAGAYRLFAVTGTGTQLLYSAPSTAAIIAEGDAALTLDITKNSGINVTVTDDSTDTEKKLTLTATGTLSHDQNVIPNALVDSFAQEIATDTKLPLSNRHTLDGRFTALGLDLYTLLTDRLGLEDTDAVTIVQTNPALQLYKEKGDGNITEADGVYTKTTTVTALTQLKDTFDLLLKSNSTATLAVKKGEDTVITITVSGTGLTLNAPTDAALKALDEIRGAAMIGDKTTREARINALRAIDPDVFTAAGLTGYNAAIQDRYLAQMIAAPAALTTKAALEAMISGVNDVNTAQALILSYAGKGTVAGATAGSYTEDSKIAMAESGIAVDGIGKNYVEAKGKLTKAMFETALGIEELDESKLPALQAIVLMSRATDWADLAQDLEATAVTLSLTAEYSVPEAGQNAVGYRTKIKNDLATVDLTSGFKVKIKSGALTYDTTPVNTPYTTGSAFSGAVQVGGVDAAGWESGLTNVTHMAALADRTETTETVLYKANAKDEGLGYFDDFGTSTRYKSYLGRMYGNFGTAANGTLTPFTGIDGKTETYYMVYFDTNDRIIGYSVQSITFEMIS